MQTTTTPPPPPPARSRYRSLEFVLGACLTGVMILLVLASGWLFPDGGESMDLARLTARFASAAHPLRHRPAGPRRARPRHRRRQDLAAGRLRLGAGRRAPGHRHGLISGYYRGFWDMIVMRFADAAGAALHPGGHHLIAILGGGLFNVIFMIISQWVQYARLVRAQVLMLREREFVLAARASACATCHDPPPHRAQPAGSAGHPDDAERRQQYPAGKQPDLPGL